MGNIEENTAVVRQIRADALPLGQPADLDPLLNHIGDKQFILLGEASHGTHEFQQIRAAISRRLITECGNFALVAVEADGPDCVPVDRSIRLMDGAVTDPDSALDEQRHWPSWMISNSETAGFCRWLRNHNGKLPEEQRVSWRGLDQLPLWAMTRHILGSLSRDEVNTALDAPLQGKPMVPKEAVAGVAKHLAIALAPEKPVAAASYYSKTLLGGTKAMNARSKHWLDVLDQTLDQHGPKSRIILWAHNTHVGDTRGTNMGFASIGQLMREHYSPGNVALIGTAGGSGTVMAAPERGLAMKKIAVPEPRSNSIEALLTDARSSEPALFVFPEQRKGWLTSELAHRAIGAVYYPDRDNLFYVPTKLGLRYDALCWYPSTTPVSALHFDAAQQGELETLRTPD